MKSLAVLAAVLALTACTAASAVHSSDTSSNQAAAATNGKIAFAGNFGLGRLVLETVNPDGTGVAYFGGGIDMSPTFSPDGTKMLFTRFNRTCCRRTSGFFVINPDGTGTKRLSGPDQGNAATAAWSPDSTKVAFSAGGPSTVYVVNADGTGP